LKLVSVTLSACLGISAPESNDLILSLPTGAKRGEKDLSFDKGRLRKKVTGKIFNYFAFSMQVAFSSGRIINQINWTETSLDVFNGLFVGLKVFLVIRKLHPLDDV
jgi:hypothetical protein